MKIRTIILILVLLALILAVILIPRLSSPVKENPDDPAAPASSSVSTGTGSESEPEEKETVPTPEPTDTPELGGEDEEIIEIEDNQNVGGL